MAEDGREEEEETVEKCTRTQTEEGKVGDQSLFVVCQFVLEEKMKKKKRKKK